MLYERDTVTTQQQQETINSSHEKCVAGSVHYSLDIIVCPGLPRPGPPARHVLLPVYRYSLPVDKFAANPMKDPESRVTLD